MIAEINNKVSTIHYLCAMENVRWVQVEGGVDTSHMARDSM